MAFSDIEKKAISKLAKHGDIALVFAVVGVMAGLIIPMPPVIIDLLLTFNITLALVILLVCMNVDEALDFSVFPSMLLFTALLRLALNVSTTRQILLKGYAGNVIEAFGGFVVGGNYVVGIVIFAILLVIQFAVITKGSGRIAEVTARFTLDAMPGKQMSIDADLNSGIIDEQEAKERRNKIRREADFYGAMDGASKFVRGDATAGLIITAINILGGFGIGMFQLGLPFKESLAKYTILTIGDGLVAQIPSLVISIAAGIIVTRAGDDNESLGTGIFKQLLVKPQALRFAAWVMLGFAVVPGLPGVPFGALSIFSFAISFFVGKSIEHEESKEKVQTEEAPKPRVENVEDLLSIDPMELEIGYGLIPLIDTSQGGDVLERISNIRKQFASEYGVVVPPIRIRDNMQLEASNYNIKIKGISISGGNIIPDCYLAMNPGQVEQEITEGIKTKDPVFGLPAVWVSESEREQAESYGYTVVDASTALITHISEILKKNSYELLGRQETQNLIDNIKKKYPAVVEELIPSLMNIGAVQKVLQNLLKEQVSIRNLGTILETLADNARTIKDVDVLTEYVRKSLSGIISQQYVTGDGNIYVLTVDPALEQYMGSSVQYNEQGSSLVLEPEFIQQILDATSDKVTEVAAKGFTPVLLCSPLIRFHYKRMLERTLPDIAVISYSEITNSVGVESLGNINVALPQSIGQPQEAAPVF